MICPKCKQTELIPDHDRVMGVEAYACRKCGYRHYPAYPRRKASPDDHQYGGASAGRQLISGTGNRHREAVKGICRRCHEPLEGGPNRKYCTPCSKIVKQQQQREYQEYYRHRMPV